MALDNSRQNIGERAFTQEHGYRPGSLEDLMGLLDSNGSFFVGVVYSDGIELQLDTISRRSNGDYLLLLHEKPVETSYQGIKKLIADSQDDGFEPKIYLH